MHKEHALFGFLQKLNRDEIHSLESIATRVSFKKKEYVFQANLTNNTIYVLTEGRIKISRLSTMGQECIQWFCFPGEIFGLSEHTYDRDSGLYAQALIPSNVWAFSKSEFYGLLHKKPGMALTVVDQLSSRVRTLGDMLLHVSCENVNARLINFLQRLSEFYGKPSDQQIRIDMYLTHQEIADMIGVCRQTVSSLMAQLKRQGIISTDKKSIVINSLASLEHLGKTNMTNPDPQIRQL
ncbi:Crp/Fnr family transcriptional regulator [Kaarinaea lacus]